MSERDELLRALLAGERSVDDEEVQRAFYEDPELRQRYEAGRATVDLLDSAGDFHRDLAQEVDRERAVPGEDRVEAFVASRVDARRPRPSRMPLVAAAAALLLALLVWRPWSDGVPSPDGRLLGAGIEDLRPSGEVERFEEFTWTDSMELEPGEWYEVVVRGADGEEVDRSEKLRAPVWSLLEGTASAWPAAIQWEVIAYDSAAETADKADTADKAKGAPPG